MVMSMETVEYNEHHKSKFEGRNGLGIAAARCCEPTNNDRAFDDTPHEAPAARSTPPRSSARPHADQHRDTQPSTRAMTVRSRATEIPQLLRASLSLSRSRHQSSHQNARGLIEHPKTSRKADRHCRLASTPIMTPIVASSRDDMIFVKARHVETRVSNSERHLHYQSHAARSR